MIMLGLRLPPPELEIIGDQRTCIAGRKDIVENLLSRGARIRRHFSHYAGLPAIDQADRVEASTLFEQEVVKCPRVHLGGSLPSLLEQMVRTLGRKP